MDGRVSQRDAELSDLEAARGALESQLREAREAAQRQEEAYERVGAAEGGILYAVCRQ